MSFYPHEWQELLLAIDKADEAHAVSKRTRKRVRAKQPTRKTQQEQQDGE